MNIIKKPSRVLNPAYRKINVTRNEINNFKSALNVCLEHIKISEEKKESEENMKKYVGDFLHQAFYKDYLINTKGNVDLGIYAGKDATSNISVLIEAKRPSNTSEFLRQDNINKKALHELLLYYLKERVVVENNQIKYLIATNGNEWYFFKGEDFYNTFYKNKKLLKEYNEFRSGQKDSSKNELFYNEIAKKYIEEVKDELPFLYIDIKKDFQEFLPIKNTEDDKLVSLYKVFSPTHLLAQSYGNDSNLLNKDFYFELLHIMGLEEVKEEGKKIIQRKEKTARNEGALLETTIFILEDRDYLRKVKNISIYGQNKEEQLFNIALELCLTWINRILFLKLLEAQLVAYNEDSNYKFLNTDFITRFNDLETLFFSALAKKVEDRNERIKEKYKRIPYLNSSLFEPNELEDSTLRISTINGVELEPYNKTILKDNLKRSTGKIPLLEYIFRFLDAYDFSGEKGEKIDESNQAKTLISASVLGLIFEKINGYKDGSFYTPAYITMYMAKEALRRAVVQKFNTHYTWKCSNFEQLKEDLKDYIRNGDRETIRKEANQIINSLKICDPAVGSGHFLVSALNELIAIKSELGILIDKDGKRLNAYIQIDNDELIIEDENEEIFTYKPKNKTSQRLQETLFHEKQNLIESCLFGVDINPNSVKICRLRLWIELLKSAYYTEEKQLQTLPNIDINIKTGNSLISRFDLDEDLKNAFKSKDNPYNLEDYKNAVQEYKNTNNKERKREIIKIIDTIKSAFTGTLDGKFKKKIASARGKLEQKQTEVQNLEAFGQKISKNLSSEFKKLKLTLNKAEEEKEGLLNNIIYQNAFEWRFEFPEVLDENGNFVGFDIVIGNPPYMYRNADVEKFKEYFKENYFNTSGNYDLYKFFIEIGIKLSNQNGISSLITNSSFLLQTSFSKTREFLLDNVSIETVIPLGDNVFEEATVDSAIYLIKKSKVIDYSVNVILPLSPNELVDTVSYTINQNRFRNNEFFVFDYLLNDREFEIVKKLILNFPKMENLYEFGVGINTGYIKKELTADVKIDERYHPMVAGTGINKYGKVETTGFIMYDKEFVKNKGKLGRTLPDEKFFTEPKIVIVRTRSISLKERIIATIDYNQTYNLNRISNIISKNNNSIEGLLGVISSKLYNWLYSKRYFDYEIKPIYLRNSPVCNTNDDKLINLVNQILFSKKQNPNTDTSALENEIDILVYKLYGLSYEEVLIIDSDFGLSEEEYNEKVIK